MSAGSDGRSQSLGDLVVVPDDESSEWTIRGITVDRNDEVMARLQPTAIAMIEGFFRSKL